MSERDRQAPYRTMREIAGDERPRERLLLHGPGVLGDADLVAILLGSGVRGENVLDVARALLESAGGLDGVARLDPAALRRRRGLGPAKAATLAAAFELGRRAHGSDAAARPLLTTPEAVFALMGPRLAAKPKEELHVLALDRRGRLLGAPAMVAGGVSTVTARPAEVFREPVVLHAASVVLVHNHPSGDPRPSPQDVTVTRTLEAAAEILELELQDHVVIGQGKFISFAREGLLGGRKPGR